DPHGAERRIRFRLQVCESDRADRQQDAARDAEQLRQAEEAVRRFHAEAVMQNCARSSRAEAEQEAIEDCLMQMTSCVSITVFLLEVAALTLPTVEVAQRCRLLQGTPQVLKLQGGCGYLFPIAPQPNGYAE